MYPNKVKIMSDCAIHLVDGGVMKLKAGQEFEIRAAYLDYSDNPRLGELMLVLHKYETMPFAIGADLTNFYGGVGE